MTIMGDSDEQGCKIKKKLCTEKILKKAKIYFRNKNQFVLI